MHTHTGTHTHEHTDYTKLNLHSLKNHMVSTHITQQLLNLHIKGKQCIWRITQSLQQRRRINKQREHLKYVTQHEHNKQKT